MYMYNFNITKRFLLYDYIGVDADKKTVYRIFLIIWLLNRLAKSNSSFISLSVKYYVIEFLHALREIQKIQFKFPLIHMPASETRSAHI